MPPPSRLEIYRALGVMLMCASLCSLAEAAERVRAGKWEGTWTGAGRTRPTSSCMTRADADALNGDATAVRALIERTVPPTVCKLTDLKLNGQQIIYTTVCGGMQNVVTTQYHGDSFESLDSSGAKSVARRTGAC